MSKELVSNAEKFIERAASLRVAVIGETIIDEFVEVIYEGHSMKSFCPVFRFVDSVPVVSQMGGASAIAGHLREFVKEVKLFSNKGREIVKTRYIDNADKKKHVELNHFDRSSFAPISIDTKDYDVVIVADFGHGYCDALQINDGFHLMCQTNSNNFGFNRMSKWKKFRKKSVTLDLREASLQMNRSIIGTKDEDVKELFNYELNTEKMFVTLGGSGSLFTDGKTIMRHAAYPSRIVDTIGAGDTYFSFCCLAALSPVPDLTVPSLAASLSTTWLCNEKSVTKQSLLDYAERTV